jgi:signal peptidase I
MERPPEENVETPSTEVLIVEESVVVEQVVSQRRVPVHHVIGWLLLDRVRAMVSMLVLAIFVLTFVMQPFRIPSESMERTLLVGDFLLVNKALYGPAGMWGWLLPYREPQRGDIVVFRFPLDPDDHVVKRVIGVSGDKVHLHNGTVFRNEVPLTEPYTQQLAPSGFRVDPFRDDFPLAEFTDPGVDAHWWLTVQHNLVNGEVMVPPEKYFVMGDNRNHSRDSRYWGFVPRENIVGMPMIIYFSVREPSRTDVPPPPAAIGDRLGKSGGKGPFDFARWDRFLRIVQ